MEELHYQPGGEPRTTNPRGVTRFESLLSPWIWTVLFIVGYIIIVVVYSRKNVFSPAEKSIFDFLTTGLSVFLGLSFYVNPY